MIKLIKTELSDKGIQYDLRIFNKRIYVSNHFLKIAWFRIFGIGIHWKHKSKGLLFSERNGIRKYFTIGEWIIGFLKYNKSMRI